MKVVIGVLASFLAALAFFVVEPMLLGLEGIWKFIAVVLVFVIVIGIVFFLARSQSSASKEPRAIGVKNKAMKDLSIEMKDVKVRDGSGDIASGNESLGNTKIKISDSEI